MINKKHILAFGSLVATATPIITLVSCGTTQPHKTKVTEVPPKKSVVTTPLAYKGGSQSLIGRVEGIYELNDMASSFGKNIVLKDTGYNTLYDEMMETENTVAIAVIANHKAYTDIVKITKGETVLQALDSSRFIFKRYMHEYMGAFINSFALRDDPKIFMHGTRTEQNYNDYYPLYYINHKFASLGVSNFHLAGHEMLEFSYDDK